MTSFQELYRAIFQNFGYPLSDRNALSPGVVAQAETRLGVRIPPALRDYYLVAGRERRFNTACHRLLPPSEWDVESKRLLFMQENQAVCSWGVSLRDPNADDPPVTEVLEDESAYLVQRKCSVFLVAMLHHQAVMDGLPYTGIKDLDESEIPRIRSQLKKNAWTYYGELKGEKVFSRPNQVVCFCPSDMMLLAGGKTKRDLRAIETELGVSVES